MPLPRNRLHILLFILGPIAGTSNAWFQWKNLLLRRHACIHFIPPTPQRFGRFPRILWVSQPKTDEMASVGYISAYSGLKKGRNLTAAQLYP